VLCHLPLGVLPDLGSQWIRREEAARRKKGEVGVERERAKRQSIKEELGIDLEWAIERWREHQREFGHRWDGDANVPPGAEDEVLTEADTEADFDEIPFRY
jgi:hypothetical protein